MKQNKTIKQLKDSGLVTTAAQIPSRPKPKNLFIEENLKGVRDTWVKEIEEYCFKEGIFPHDLIVSHQKLKKLKMRQESGKESKIQDFSKIQLGDEPYNPNKNPVWRKKMGLKEERL